MSLTPFLNPRDHGLEANYLTTPRDPEVLSIRDARRFENQPYRAKVEGNVIVLSPHGERQSFVELNDNRRSAQADENNAADRWEKLNSEEGIALNNLGISAEITLSIKGQQYLLVVHQDRRDTMGDEVLKLVSGFVDSHSFDPTEQSGLAQVVSALATELREELLLLQQDSALRAQVHLPLTHDLGDLLQLTSEEGTIPLTVGADSSIDLPPPYSSRFAYSDEQQVRFRSKGARSVLPSASPISTIRLDGVEIEGRLMIDETFQSGQLILSFELEMPDGVPLSITHAEETPVNDSDVERGIIAKAEPGVLKTVFRPNGILLLQLDDTGRVNGNAFNLHNGELVQVHLGENVLLSEAFVPSERIEGTATGIVTSQNIPLSDVVSG